jgi:hypothetical protein
MSDPEDSPALASLSEIAEHHRQRALEHYQLIRSHLEQDLPLTRVAQDAGVPLRTAQRWVNRYRRFGLAGLVRSGRSGLDRGLFQSLTTCAWIRDSHHVLIAGPTGVGKSWLACALGHKACRDGFSVLYRRAPRLFADLATARGEGRLARLMRSLERTRLLIIDDWGPEPLNAEQRRDLLEIVDDREGKGSLLVTSQVPISRWHEIIGDPTLGDAILDRVIHRSHRIELKGESLRKRQTLAAVESLTNAREK